jgi:hypothetical protein
MPTRLARVLAADYVEGVEGLPIAELRSRRGELQEVEVAISYQRRLCQGRLDILVADLQRRADGGSSDIQHLIDHLTPILAEGPRLSRGALPPLLAPDFAEGDLCEELDAIIPAGTIGDLPDLTDAEVLAIGEQLRDLEKRYSTERRALHEQLSNFERELVRRYKSGELDVDSLLQ